MKLTQQLERIAGEICSHVRQHIIDAPCMAVGALHETDDPVGGYKYQIDIFMRPGFHIYITAQAGSADDGMNLIVQSGKNAVERDKMLLNRKICLHPDTLSDLWDIKYDAVRAILESHPELARSNREKLMLIAHAVYRSVENGTKAVRRGHEQGKWVESYRPAPKIANKYGAHEMRICIEHDDWEIMISAASNYKEFDDDGLAHVKARFMLKDALGDKIFDFARKDVNQLWADIDVIKEEAVAAILARQPQLAFGT